jgi:hypothetical protein
LKRKETTAREPVQLTILPPATRPQVRGAVRRRVAREIR